MKKFTITKINKYNYELTDEKERKYSYNIGFYDIEKKPNVGDYIYMSEKILQENNNMLNFGSLDSIYGREINDSSSDEVIVLVMNNEKFYLIRLYG